MADLEACASLCRAVYGFERTNELRDAIGAGTSFVAVREGRVSAYTSGLALFGHTIAEREDDVRALIVGVAQALREPVGFILPTRQTNLFHWCLRERMRLVRPMTLMAIGEYPEPAGSWFPSSLC